MDCITPALVIKIEIRAYYLVNFSNEKILKYANTNFFCIHTNKKATKNIH